MTTTLSLPTQRRDPEWDAATYLLTAPLIADLTAAFVSWEEHDVDWPKLRAAARAWSSGERLLVEAAWDLWSGDGTKSLMDYIRSLDDENLKRVFAAMRIRRGWTVQ